MIFVSRTIPILICECGLILSLDVIGKTAQKRGKSLYVVCPACKRKITYETGEDTEKLATETSVASVAHDIENAKEEALDKVNDVRTELQYFKQTINDMWAVTEQTNIDLEKQKDKDESWREG